VTASTTPDAAVVAVVAAISNHCSYTCTIAQVKSLCIANTSLRLGARDLCCESGEC